MQRRNKQTSALCTKSQQYCLTRVLWMSNHMEGGMDWFLFLPVLNQVVIFKICPTRVQCIPIAMPIWR